MQHFIGGACGEDGGSALSVLVVHFARVRTHFVAIMY